MFKSYGKLVYNPKSHLGDPSKWLILSCDDEITKYYCHLYQKEHRFLNTNKSIKLNRPVFGAHVSIIRGEYIPNFQLWGLSKNKLMEFEYEPGVLDNGEYYWLKVHCPELQDLRIKYGLSPHPKFGYHLTIGRI